MKIQTFRVGVMQTNCYFLIDESSDAEKNAAIVDPGDDAGLILKKLSEKNLVCTKILVTHSHFDHIMALEQVRKATGAKVYVHADDAESLTNNDINMMTRFSSDSVKIRPADVVIHDGDIIKVGEASLRVLHTPGHTPGSVCFITENAIISGDTLFRDDIGRYDLPGGNYTELIKSLKKLQSIDGDCKVYPGHGASTTLSYEKEHNLYMK